LIAAEHPDVIVYTGDSINARRPCRSSGD